MSFTRRIIVFSTVLLGLGLRVRAVPPSLGDVDGVNFARALAFFDPLHQAPHAYGYPVFVALTKLFSWLGCSDVLSLVLPSLISFPIALVLFTRNVERRFGRAPAIAALVFVAFAPPCVTYGAWPSSDGFGFDLLLLAIAFALDPPPADRSIAAGLSFGLMLGTRLSWWPLAIPLFYLTSDRKRFAIGTVLATSVWLLALCWFVSPLALIEASLAFGRGHFTDWGMGAIGFAWRALSVVLAIAIGRFLPRTLSLAMIPYAIWILCAQNLDNPRHFLPLLPWLGIGVGMAIRSLDQRRLIGALAAGALFALALVQAIERGTELPPAAAIARTLMERSPENLQVFAGRSAHVIRHLAPMVRISRPASAEVLKREAALARARGADVFVVSDAPGAPPSSELALSRWVDEEIHASR